MDPRYDQDDWQLIIEIHVSLGCCVSETLRVVRMKYPQYAHLARETFEEYLESEEGKKQLAEEIDAYKSEIEGNLAINREKWDAMSLYRLWEECAKELLKRALAGDRDAERKAIQYLRLANSMLKAAQFEQSLEEDSREMEMFVPGPQVPAPAPKPQPSSTAALATVLACASACAPANPSATTPKPAPRTSVGRVANPPHEAPATGPERILAADKHR